MEIVGTKENKSVQSEVITYKLTPEEIAKKFEKVKPFDKNQYRLVYGFLREQATYGKAARQP